MNRSACAVVLLAAVGAGGCAEAERNEVPETGLHNAAAVAGAAEFKRAGIELNGDLTCTATLGESCSVVCAGVTTTEKGATMTGQVANDVATAEGAGNAERLEALEWLGMVAGQEVFRKTCIGSGC